MTWAEEVVSCHGRHGGVKTGEKPCTWQLLAASTTASRLKPFAHTWQWTSLSIAMSVATTKPWLRWFTWRWTRWPTAVSIEICLIFVCFHFSMYVFIAYSLHEPILISWSCSLQLASREVLDGKEGETVEVEINIWSAYMISIHSPIHPCLYSLSLTLFSFSIFDFLLSLSLIAE